MKQKFVIYYLKYGYFTGSNFDRAYFSNEETPRLFDTERQAIDRLQDEEELFPKQFENGIFEIKTIFTFPIN